jgi:hypothetical protein
MEVAELSNMLASNLGDVLTPSGYKSIIRKDNNLLRYDILNRILIQIQSNNAFDIRTEEEWLMCDRKIKKNQHPIYIVTPKYVSKYIDTETGNDLADDELTNDEIVEALKYNIISRVDRIECLYTNNVYDIRQTINTSDSKYNVSKPHISTKNIISLAKDILNCDIEICDETFYSKSENKFYISKQSYNSIAKSISEVLINYYLKNIKMTLNHDKSEDNNSSDSEDSRENFSDYEIELIEDTLRYSINTLFHIESNIDFEVVRHIDNERLLQILNLVDSIVFDISSRIKFDDEYLSSDISKNINLAKKAEALLDIMEAHNINKIMKGV